MALFGKMALDDKSFTKSCGNGWVVDARGVVVSPGMVVGIPPGNDGELDGELGEEDAKIGVGGATMDVPPPPTTSKCEVATFNGCALGHRGGHAFDVGKSVELACEGLVSSEDVKKCVFEVCEGFSNPEHANCDSDEALNDIPDIEETAL